MSQPPLFRFAPSPNGLLHLGHAYAALFAQKAARDLGGELLLRIEDIDTARCKPEFDQAMQQDLEWLGLVFEQPPLRQSERFGLYAEIAETMRQEGLIYPCFCSRSTVAASASGTDPDGAPLYAGTCRHIDKAEARARITGGEPVVWRIDMSRALRRLTGPLHITEYLVLGHDLATSRTRERIAHPERWGDSVLVRKDVPTSYHLSVVIDDTAQNITHVTRGMDLYHATDLHRLLQALLGLATPIYAHHGLVRDGTEQKLSKSRGSTGLRDLRELGWTPERVRTELGFGDPTPA